VLFYFKDGVDGFYALKDMNDISALPTGCTSITKADAIAQGLLRVPTSEEMQQNISNEIQRLLDTTAQSMRYDNILSARSYAGYSNPFQAEALSLAAWSAACWAKAGEIQHAVIDATRVMPTVDEALAEMPVFKL
jgi:hypothetical protein